MWKPQGNMVQTCYMCYMVDVDVGMAHNPWPHFGIIKWKHIHSHTKMDKTNICILYEHICVSIRKYTYIYIHMCMCVYRGPIPAMFFSAVAMWSISRSGPPAFNAGTPGEVGTPHQMLGHDLSAPHWLRIHPLRNGSLVELLETGDVMIRWLGSSTG